MAGSLRQRGEDSWELRVHAGRDETTGAKRYVTRTVRGRRRAAELALAKLVTEVEEGSVSARNGTVRELCDRWFEYASPGLSPTVAPEYRRILDQRVLPKFGSTPLRRLRTSELDTWYAMLSQNGGQRGQPLAANSVHRIHAVLRRALNQGVKWGWIAINPAAAATPPKLHRISISVPSAQEIGELIHRATEVNPGLPVFLRLAAISGARRGEMCSIRWRHIDFDAGALHIQNAIIMVAGKTIEKDTKTHAERRMRLDQRTLEVLRDYRSLLDSIVPAPEQHRRDMYVFSHDPEGQIPWRPDYVTTAFGRLARQQQLDGLRLHDLRHFSATTMLANGVDIRTASGRLGHANTSTTLDVYSHFVKAADDRAADTLASIIDAL